MSQILSSKCSLAEGEKMKGHYYKNGLPSKTILNLYLPRTHPSERQLSFQILLNIIVLTRKMTKNMVRSVIPTATSPSAMLVTE